ncbi:glycosyltransferase family 39 protein [Hymenobacter negativus]|uniref:Glycosyltransferase family 39 protein n=1 Tax=Hymenobacter negativus TaxID=2795026 RepID=A0ABS0Q4P6_9BACT|nr:glycosyltransferase family 39 protein [Hymenobacter negativus]MBH8557645.1 glycosyltransferase family 39 protein [Hymenobacter negativus]
MATTASTRIAFGWLFGIMLLGLALRIAFVLKGTAAFYHSPGPFVLNGDSFSYTLAFENLWLRGRYTFDFLEPDASFGRLPGYPFFYGAHWIVFGSARAAAATAWSQVLLDTGAIALVFAILRRLEPNQPRTAYLGALLYAAYPFIIVWVPIIGTEILATDLTLLWFWVMLQWRPTPLYLLGIGALAALVLLVRAYMGVLLPITVMWVLWQTRKATWHSIARNIGLAMLGFGLLYGGWPVRNYLLAHRLVLLKPKTAGYANQTVDVDEFYQWVHCWTTNENPWLDSVLIGKGRIHFPAAAFSSAAEENQAQQLVACARQCGSGFWVLRNGISNSASYYRDTAAVLADTAYQKHHFRSCNEEIGAGFQSLRRRFAAEHPFRFWLDVPLQNVQKALFKSTMAKAPVLEKRAAPPRVGLMQLLFGYRTVLVLLGWGGILVGIRRQPALGLVAAVAGLIYLYICFLYRGLEMRYLLQADVLLLIPAALWLGRWLPAGPANASRSSGPVLPA